MLNFSFYLSLYSYLCNELNFKSRLAFLPSLIFSTSILFHRYYLYLSTIITILLYILKSTVIALYSFSLFLFFTITLLSLTILSILLILFYHYILLFLLLLLALLISPCPFYCIFYSHPLNYIPNAFFSCVRISHPYLISF